MTKPNIYTNEFSYDPQAPADKQCAAVPIGEQAGGTDTTVILFEIQPGAHIGDYHYEFVEEWLIVLDGQVQVRNPDGIELAGRGAVVRFPPGPDGAHIVMNTSAEPARVMMFSKSELPSVAIYPDAGKVGVWTSNAADAFMFDRADGSAS